MLEACITLIGFLIRLAALLCGGKVCRLSVRDVARTVLQPYGLDIAYGNQSTKGN